MTSVRQHSDLKFGRRWCEYSNLSARIDRLKDSSAESLERFLAEYATVTCLWIVPESESSASQRESATAKAASVSGGGRER